MCRLFAHTMLGTVKEKIQHKNSSLLENSAKCISCKWVFYVEFENYNKRNVLRGFLVE